MKVFIPLTVYSKYFNLTQFMFVGIQFPDFLANAINMPEDQQIGENYLVERNLTIICISKFSWHPATLNTVRPF